MREIVVMQQDRCKKHHHRLDLWKWVSTKGKLNSKTFHRQHMIASAKREDEPLWDLGYR